MTIQTINIGGYANDGTGDDLRTAFTKVNENFLALSGDVNIVSGANVGVGTGIFAQKNLANLEFKSLTSTDNSVTITSTSTTVNLKATASIVEDTSPMLGADLDLNGYRIINTEGGSGLETNVYGISVPILNSLLELMITSNQLNIDFNTFLDPVAYLDMGEFVGPYNFSNNNIDFGTF